MIKDIVTDKKELSRICHPVHVGQVAQIVEDMIDTANSMYDRCAGLAAPQIGYDARIIIVKMAKGWEVMINPTIITRAGGVLYGAEACLSVPATMKPGRSVRKRRYYKVAVEYNNLVGETVKKKLRGFEARVVQHEIDHLNGILIL